MRYIDKSKVVCPDGWLARAADALKDVTENGAKVDTHGGVWREYKKPLSKASHKKCWYCEMKQVRSDNAVDHFRPKSLYKWSAFSADNFRYSCTYCNSRRMNPATGETEGKGKLFPLLDEGKRASCAAEEGDETPMLLDPCRPADAGCLYFNEDGISEPMFSDPGTRRDRAKISIELYHLNNPDIVDARRALALDLLDKIEGADCIYSQCDQGDPKIESAFDSIVKSLAQALSEKAEFSSFARRIISGHREKVWVEQLLQTA